MRIKFAIVAIPKLLYCRKLQTISFLSIFSFRFWKHCDLWSKRTPDSPLFTQSRKVPHVEVDHQIMWLSASVCDEKSHRYDVCCSKSNGMLICELSASWCRNTEVYLAFDFHTRRDLFGKVANFIYNMIDYKNTISNILRKCRKKTFFHSLLKILLFLLLFILKEIKYKTISRAQCGSFYILNVSNGRCLWWWCINKINSLYLDAHCTLA